MNELKLHILSEERQKILPFFSSWKGEFYLAGGTGLALQRGHRDSVDFDFFSLHPFDTEKMQGTLSKLFGNTSFTVIQIEENTLSIVLHSDIKISFMTYRYELISPLMITDFLKIASIPDIACMKLSAIMQRSALKDYVDLYEIMKMYPLPQLITFAKQKYPTIDSFVILKSLAYLNDVVDEPLIYHKGQTKLPLDILKLFFENEVKKYMDSVCKL